jgi:hypothetical protein
MNGKKFSIILNDKGNIQEALNQLNYECDYTINQLQEQISGLINSTSLDNVEISDKSEFTKAVNSLITTKTNVLKVKLDIYKILTEILKFNGNSEAAIGSLKKDNALDAIDVNAIKRQLQKKEGEKAEKVEYKI